MLFAVKFEVRANRAFRVVVSRYTDQWVQHPNSVVLVALWVSARHHADMEPSNYVAFGLETFVGGKSVCTKVDNTC